MAFWVRKLFGTFEKRAPESLVYNLKRDVVHLRPSHLGAPSPPRLHQRAKDKIITVSRPDDHFIHTFSKCGSTDCPIT